MFQYLRNHALLNVWCNPEQDNQSITRAARVSRAGGERFAMTLMDRRLTMPTQDRRFHIFQIGDISPRTVGLLHDCSSNKWVRFTEAVQAKDLIANIHTNEGLLVPLHRCYYIYTKERALLFAVDLSALQNINLDTALVTLRLYTNAWYGSEPAQTIGVRTASNGRYANATSDITAIRNELTPYRELPGSVFCYVNGELRTTINTFTAKIGDSVEYLYDASVKRVVEWKISDLHTFTSTMDQDLKYLLHYPDAGEDQIDYVDDIDVYVVRKNGEQIRGRFLPRNQAKTLRMVTHRDYSVSVPAVLAVGEGLIDPEESLTVLDLYVRLYIRNSGTIRPLIKESSRIFELYKLPDDKVVRALTGVESSMPFWSAPALEAGDYTRLMRTFEKTMHIEEVEKAYGYNGVTKVIGETPSKVAAGTSYAPLSPAYQRVSTIYEYDADGKLLEWHPHENGSACMIRNPNTRMIEAIVGKGQRDLETIYGEDYLIIPPNVSYRVYMCYKVDDVPNRQWEDVTDSEHYRVESGLLIWNNLVSNQYLMVRTTKTFLAYEFDMVAIAGTYYFDLTEKVGEDLRVLDAPLGDLDVWVNGKSLVKGVGFVYQHPRVFIVDKEHLLQPAGSTPQRITVRFAGFPDKELNLKKIEDKGFVTHGMLSNNHRFNVRDDKVLRITVGGSLKHRSDVKFGDLDGSVSVVNAINGQPYQVKEMVVPVETWTKTETYKLREEALVRDKAVSDYLTRMLPEPERPAVSSMVSRYTVYSPFISHLVNDIESGQFNRQDIEKELTDNDVLQLCQSYEYLLEFDPINDELGFDRNFVVIHPHQLNRRIELDMYGYAFIQKVVKLYAKGLVDLSSHLNIRRST